MAIELWEIVHPRELKVGDVILSADYDHPIVWREVDANTLASFPGHYRLNRLRRYSGPSPELMARAFELMAHDLVDRGSIEDGEKLEDAVRQVCRDYLAMAELNCLAVLAPTRTAGETK